ncbi:MAG: VanW family protein [Clostridia bacterium]|nr:VanW family protein [Clostridia bacterium]
MDKIKKIYKLIIMSALSAGIIFLSCAFTLTVSKGVEVDGIPVGGMTVTEAAATVRNRTEDELKDKRLIIRGDKNTYEFRYPEINYKDDLFRALRNAAKGQKLEYAPRYYLCGMEEIVKGICNAERVEAVEPYATFNTFGEPFTYGEGSDGKEVNRAVLTADIKSALCGGFEKITLQYTAAHRTKNYEEVIDETQKLSSFTTYFDGSNLNRVSNIRLAAAKLNGTVLKGGEILSFNTTVGERTKKHGFLPAKIIENGEFTEGVGGGVCQVSTTLYNCALLAGLKVEEYHPHSLAVGYVPPSRDAMVSGISCDLKLKNVSEKPVYIRAATGSNYVRFDFYGLCGEETYSLSSEVTGTLTADCEITDDPEKVRDGKDGLTSQGYLIINRGGFTKKVLLRKDKYLPVKGFSYFIEENKND